MPIEIVRNDITRMKVDAIVNAANNRLANGGGVCGAIHRAAGPKLLEECNGLGGCKTGDAKITGAYRLPCRYVIHTVGPVWQGGAHGERALLAACYRRSLQLAQENGCRSVAFPLISAGIFGYPKDQALRVAMDTIRDYLMECDDEGELYVYIVVFDRESFQISDKLYAGIAEYISDHYADAHDDTNRRRRLMEKSLYDLEEVNAAPCAAASLEEALGQIDESFSEMVLRKIDEKGMKDPECYKRANLDRKHFSKLRKDPKYQPGKQTAIALAIALELTLPETQELLMKAGFALSHSNRADIIVEYFILNRNYDIMEINAALYSFDEMLLGATR